MRRSHRFPYTARSSAIKICHAVAIDERRAKFRQDLISPRQEKQEEHKHVHLSYFRRRNQTAIAPTGENIRSSRSYRERGMRRKRSRTANWESGVKDSGVLVEEEIDLRRNRVIRLF